MTRQVAPTGLLILLSAAVLLSLLCVLRLGPLLVPRAQECHTSVAGAGQLGAATAITWGITALLAGPVSDAYGQRRRVLLGLLLGAVGMCGAVRARTYGLLLAFRLLTGGGAALIPPNGFALLAESCPPTARGKAMGWVCSASGVGAACGVPLGALLVAAGGGRLPCAVLGVTALGRWSLGWPWLPWPLRPPGQPVACLAQVKSFFSGKN